MKKVMTVWVLGLLLSSQAHANFYQVGSVWDKKPLLVADLPDSIASVKKAALALGKVGGGATAFYIGKFADRHLMMTNHHVYPFGCRDESLTFEFYEPYGKVKFDCQELIASWLELDTSIFSIKVSEEQEKILLPNALVLGWDDDVTPGQRLVTLGYGTQDNVDQSHAMIDQGEDCRVMSSKNDFRIRPDFDPNYSDEFKVWSVAHACESSQGDSGSAMLDRESGKVVSIVWTTQIEERGEKYKKSQTLLDLIEEAKKTPFTGTDRLTVPGKDEVGPQAEIWNKMNYGVPLKVVKEFIKKAVDDPAAYPGSKKEGEVVRNLDPQWRDVLKKLIE